MIDPELNDIFVDDDGKLWRCIAVCTEPTVTFEEVEGRALSPQNLSGMQQLAAQNNYLSGYSPSIFKDRKSGGARGAMWDGWKRIHRPAVDLK